MWATGRCLRGLGWGALLAVLATGCFDEVDGENERDSNDTEVGTGDAGDMETGPPDAGDRETGPFDAGDMQPEVDADLRPCVPDEDGGPCSAGVGACEVLGRKICRNGMFVCDAVAGEPKEELCNGLDDDCDGLIDEPQPCYEGVDGTQGTGRCVGGTRSCVDGEWSACEGQIVPGDESCDGVDEDCDGATDEGRRDVEDEPAGPLRVPCAEYAGPAGTDGVGVCARGTMDCQSAAGAAPECRGVVLPGDEICNAVDDDCDGVVDEGTRRLCSPYGGPPETEGVGTCRASTEVCPTAPEGERDGLGCVDEVLPEAADACDGRDEDCDGRIDVGADDTPSCGEFVAGNCRLWLMWSRDREFDLTPPNPDFFDTWAGCPLDGEPGDGGPQEFLGRDERCVQTGLDGDFRGFVFPGVHQPGPSDSLAVRWECLTDFNQPDAVRVRLRAIQRHCRVTIGEQWSQDGWQDDMNPRLRPEPPAIAEGWNPCEDGDEGCTCAGVDGQDEFGLVDQLDPDGFASRCTSSYTDVLDRPKIRGWNFTGGFSELTRLGISFHCPDAPVEPQPAEAPVEMFRSVQSQTAVWLGWATDADEPAVWGACDRCDVIDDASPQCASTGGDGAFHRLRINATTGGVFRPGGLGVALRAQPVSDEDPCEIPMEMNP